MEDSGPRYKPCEVEHQVRNGPRSRTKSGSTESDAPSY